MTLRRERKEDKKRKIKRRMKNEAKSNKMPRGGLAPPFSADEVNVRQLNDIGFLEFC
jgi:hypothetical protein